MIVVVVESDKTHIQVFVNGGDWVTAVTVQMDATFYGVPLHTDILSGHIILTAG